MAKTSKGTTFRVLTAEDVETRVQQIKPYQGGCYVDLLIYKNARVDRAILDDTFGIFGWQSEYSLINGNLFCTIKVKDSETNEWISKQDVGVESNMEKEKGQASDAFKRAAFAWGVGVELYSSPHIRIFPLPGYFSVKDNKAYLNATPEVTGLEVDESTRKITFLQITLVPDYDTKAPYVAYTYGRCMPSRQRISDCAAWVLSSGNSTEAGLDLLRKSYNVNAQVAKALEEEVRKLEKTKA